MTLAYDEVWVREPRLMVPGQKPVGSVRLRHESPFVKNATHLLTFNDGRVPPVDAKTGLIWTANTSYGSAPWVYAPANGNMCLKNSETDLNTLFYETPLDSTNIDTTSLCIVLIFTPLVVSATIEGVIQLSVDARGGTSGTVWQIYGSGSLSVGINGGSRFTLGSVVVGQRYLFATSYDPTTRHSFYCNTASPTTGTYNSTFGSEANNTILKIGSGYQGEYPCAWELAYMSYGWTPGLDALIRFVNDPWPELVIPA